ncbi:MAG: TIGR03905 family TSCPD domain-containing protein [Firmicutes bacterium]|nr:TIGR03905 family TSCPD domain-containing protein [Bacillota bacterium]
MEEFVFKPQGVCSRAFLIRHENGIIVKFEAIGGCSGNLAAISRLIEGRPMSEIADKLGGTHCGSRLSSCPDQLSVSFFSLFLTGLAISSII